MVPMKMRRRRRRRRRGGEGEEREERGRRGRRGESDGNSVFQPRGEADPEAVLSGAPSLGGGASTQRDSAERTR